MYVKIENFMWLQVICVSTSIHIFQCNFFNKLSNVVLEFLTIIEKFQHFSLRIIENFQHLSFKFIYIESDHLG
jgi:hypothetical protein